MSRGTSNPGKKRQHVEKTPKSRAEDADRITDNKDSEASELEIRLRRLENAHTSGGSDVYKFAFFFFMGILVTILIYPRISSTIDSLAGERGISQTMKQRNSYEAEPLDDTESIIDERPIEPSDLDNIDKENETVATVGMVISNPEERNLPETDDKDNIVELRPKEDKVKSKHRQVKGNKDTDKVEDLMIEEHDELEIKTEIKDASYQKVVKEIPINLNSEPQRINLFSSDVDDLGEEVPLRMEKIEKDTKRTKGAMKTNTKNGKTVKKTSENTDKQKSDARDQQNVPQEVKDFKPTYQKTLTPKKVFIDGRRIPPMELLPQKPNNSSVKVWLFEEFLSEEECDGLMRVHNKHVEEQSKDDPILCFDSVSTLRKHLKNVGRKVQVTPMDFTQGTTCVNASFSRQLKDWLKGNWSYSTAFYPGESRFASMFEQRVKQAMGLNPENGGKFQITSYPTDIGYKSHTDCTENLDDKRDRMATVLVYLDTVAEGGETDFPELGIWARPRKGRALLWNNMSPDGECEPMSIHRANKVITGHKYILQRWYYYKSFYSLGKRPPEPPLPHRNPGQPRVSCDEYEHGSCRWYDEWNFEHLIEYERQRYTLV